MKSKIKSKFFIAGILAGSIIATAVGTYAAETVVPAIMKGNLTIYVDGNPLQQEQGTYILNYGGYNYTSAREVAEGLGATVAYQKNSVTGEERIDITSATPTPTPSPTPTESASPTPTATPTPQYQYAPQKQIKLSTITKIESAVANPNSLYITLDIYNMNSQGTTMFDFNNMKIVTDSGQTYNAISRSKNFFFSSILNDTEVDKIPLEFAAIPVGTKFKLFMPIERSGITSADEKDTFEFDLISEDPLSSMNADDGHTILQYSDIN